MVLEVIGSSLTSVNNMFQLTENLLNHLELTVVYPKDPFLVHYCFCYTELEKILVLQKRAMRLMTFNDAYPTVHGPLISSDPHFL